MRLFSMASDRASSIRRAAVDTLESRRLLSFTYDTVVLAQTGAGYSAIGPNVSINDGGAVAFQGTSAGASAVFAGDGTAAFPVKDITNGFGVAGTVFNQFLQINNDNKVVTSVRQPGPKSFILLYDAKTGALTQIRGASAGATTLSSVLFPVLNNKGAVVFAATKSADSTPTQYLEDNSNKEVQLSPTTIQLRMDIADDGSVVLRKGNLPTSGIVKFPAGFGGATSIASTGTYTAIGQSPGISDDGKTVAYYATTAAGPGIYLNLNGKVTQVASVEKKNGVVTGPISDISPDSRVDVALNAIDGRDGFVTFLATGKDGKQGLYTVLVHYTTAGGITFEKPQLVVEAGQSVPKLTGTITSISVYDPINLEGDLAYTVTTSSGGTAVLRSNVVRRPVLVVPGIAGSFAENTQGFNTWLTHRGIPPSGLAIDPLAKTYDDLIQTFENQGYVMGKDLFAATYDWRVDPGPVPSNTAKPTGHVAGLSAASITDTTYKFGVDYLGYWLKTANAAWEKRFGQALDSVDIVCHSTGGLVSRTYIESDAYGGKYTDPTYGQIALPKVNDLVMCGVPNRGASGPLNPLLDNWNSDPSSAGFLSKILYTAYKKVVAGQTIFGPDYNITLSSITVNGAPNLVKFIQIFCPTLRDLLATYPAILTTPNGTPQTVDKIADIAYLNNALLNNLNGGSDANAFADDVNKAVVVYGHLQPTVTRNLQRKGPDTTGGFGDPPLFLPIFSMSDGASLPFSGHQPGANETWYEDEVDTLGGDGTVPLDSSYYPFQNDKRFVTQAFDCNHLQTVSNLDAQKFILKQLGTVVTGPFSTTLAGAAVATLKDNVVSMVMDPVDAFLVDSKGRRLGYSKATGPVNEIPGSVYFGDGTGVGFIFGPTPGTLTLKETGLGVDGFVDVLDIQGNTIGGTTQSGTLAKGATKTVTITPAAPSTKKPPVAANDTAKTVKNVAVVISPLTNDTTPNAGATLVVSSVKILIAPAHGKATIDPKTGKITYTPAAGYTGPDTLTYTVADTTGTTSNVGTISVTVAAVPADVTSKAKAVIGTATKVGTTTHYSQKVTITNSTTASLAGPLYLVFDGLTSGVTLNNKTGSVVNVSPLGSPYLTLTTGSLAAGKSVAVTLDWIDAAGKSIAFKWRLLSGVGVP